MASVRSRQWVTWSRVRTGSPLGEVAAASEERWGSFFYREVVAGWILKTGPVVLTAFLLAGSRAKRKVPKVSLHSISQMPGSYLREPAIHNCCYHQTSPQQRGHCTLTAC